MNSGYELLENKENVLHVNIDLIKPLGGLEEAIMLARIHKWLNDSAELKLNYMDGAYWIPISYKDMRKDGFDFWSDGTIKRIIYRLENMGVVKTTVNNQSIFDKTKSYTIDYDKVEELLKKTQGN